MKKRVFFPIFLFSIFIFITNRSLARQITTPTDSPILINNSYWIVLHRKSSTEHLYRGTPGDINKSTLVKSFKVKVGTPGKSPTPLPSLAGKDYWTITKKYESTDNPETAPYFIELDVPGGDAEPFGPVPYEECNEQCHWTLPGAFGLHGVGGDISKLGAGDPGSSGCVRHTNRDITYLYDILDLEHEVRYYIIEDVWNYPINLSS